MTSKLRKPDNNEADDCLRLIYMSGPHLFSYSMVAGEPKIYEILKVLYQRPDTVLSQEYVIVEEENGQIRGLFLAFPARDMKKLGMSMMKCAKDIFKIVGLLDIFRMMFRFRLNTYFPGTENDEFFISNLAVFEEYRGKGIALRLLEKAEEMAVENGLPKLSLFAELDNSRAIRAYEKFGFQEVKKVVLPKRYNKHDIFGFYKMVKVIGED
jgi:ribosomal protein S18 acetylase RimI-like enzyme